MSDLIIGMFIGGGLAAIIVPGLPYGKQERNPRREKYVASNEADRAIGA